MKVLSNLLKNRLLRTQKWQLYRFSQKESTINPSILFCLSLSGLHSGWSLSQLLYKRLIGGRRIEEIQATTKKSVGGRSRPAMSCKVIICDASSPWRLVIRDVGCYQSAGVEAYMPYRMPAAKMDNTLNIKYINRILASMCFADGCIHYCSIYKRYQLRCWMFSMRWRRHKNDSYCLEMWVWY